MGNCSASKPSGGGGDDGDPVSLCRERKRLLKSAVERRSALADAYCNYIQSLRSVAAAINLFVARHSAPTPILITLPPPSPPLSETPSFLRQTPTQPKTQTLPSSSSASSASSASSSLSSSSSSSAPCLKEERRGEVGCGYYFAGSPPSPPRDFGGWDFFNPFDGVRAAEEVAAMLGGLCRSSDEDLRVVREEEGIPDLEEEEEQEDGDEEEEEEEEEDKGGNNGEVVRMEGGEEKKERGLTVMEATVKERELLDALRDVEDQFIRAYDSGKAVAKMLEVSNKVHLHSGLDDSKDNSSKLVQAITWHRSPSSQSSSCKIDLASSSKSTTSSESKSDLLFEDYGGMESGSHSQTLVRLYAWEKKLYEEVKAGDDTRQLYERKCLQLRDKDAKGSDSRSVDKIKASVRDLYTRIWVALRSIETISTRIQKVRDEELHPQLIELLQGLMKTWEIMRESHETQKQIMLEVASFTCSAYGKFCSDSQRHVTVVLEAELQNWRRCFVSYIAAQRAYVEAIDGWLSKFFASEMDYYSRCRSSVPIYDRVGAPPLLVICHDWLNSTKKLPDKTVSYAMKGVIRDIRVLWVKQGEEQQQKKKVDCLAKELDRKALSFQKAENKVLESKLSDLKPEPDVRERMEYLAGRKDLLDMFRKKLDVEKSKHHSCMQETQRVTLDGLKMGLTRVFEALADFSKDCLKLYGELLMHDEKGKAADEVEGKPSCIEGSQLEVDNR